MTDPEEQLKTATPEQLLKAAIWFYAPLTDPSRIDKISLLRLGFALARPGGWEYIAPAWLRDVMEDENADNEN